jgi:hypothetical protein
VGDHENRSARFRYTATGALAALAAAGAIAATVAVADGPPVKTPGGAAPPSGLTKPAPGSSAPASPAQGKGPGAPMPGTTQAPQPGPQPFLNAVRRLVDNGTITATEGQAVDREILTGSIDMDTLASEGFTPAQLAAVQQALANTKRALAPPAPGTPG